MTKVNQYFIERLFSAIVGIALAMIYTIQAMLSRDSDSYELWMFLSGFGCASALVFGYWLWLHRKQINLSIHTVILWAVVFRLIGIWGEPILEDDFYRFLLDPCLTLTYGSPYGITPDSLFSSNLLGSACGNLLTNVNNPHLATIYAPFLQYIFLLSHLLLPVNLDILQLIIVLFDLSVVWMLGKLAPARMVMLYAWCPLVIKEFAFTAHPDVIGVSLLLAAFIVRQKGSSLIGAILIGLACATKILAIVALPFFLFRQSIRYWAAIAATILVLYLPFLMQNNETDLGVLAHFAGNWLFNAPLFYLSRELITDQAARYASLALFLLWYAYYFARYQQLNPPSSVPRMDWVFGLLFLLSPVLNAWYWVWVLPFAVIFPSIWAWAASVALMLSYIIGINWPESELRDYQVWEIAQVAQMAIVGAAVIIDYRFQRFRLISRVTGN